MWYKNIRAQIFLIFVFSTLGITGSVYAFSLKTDISFEERHHIEKEVFSILVDYITIHTETNVDYIFLGISGKDPSAEILDAFDSHRRPAVEPISSSIITYGFTAPVVHKSDPSKRGIQIDLEILDREPGGFVKVQASLYQNKVASAPYEYTLAKSDGLFRVVSVRRPEGTHF